MSERPEKNGQAPEEIDVTAWDAFRLQWNGRYRSLADERAALDRIKRELDARLRQCAEIDGIRH